MPSRTSRVLPIVVALLVVAALLTLVLSRQRPTSESEEAGARRAQDPATPAVATEALPPLPVGPSSGQREAASETETVDTPRGKQSSPDGESWTELRLFNKDQRRRIRGRILLDRPLSADKAMHVRLSAQLLRHGRVPEGGLEKVRAGHLEGLARAPVAADGTYEFPWPHFMRAFRVEVVSKYASGSRFVDMAEPDLPDTEALDVKAVVGSNLRLVLQLPADATREERVALVGCPLDFEVEPPMRNRASVREGTIRVGEVSGEKRLVVDLEAVRGQTIQFTEWGRSGRYTLTGKSLDPFAVPPGLEFQLRPGGNVLQFLPLVRTQRIAGRITEADGTPIEGVWIEFERERPGGSGLEWTQMSLNTDGDGRFEMHTLLGPLIRITINPKGKIALPDGSPFEAIDLRGAALDAALARPGDLVYRLARR